MIDGIGGWEYGSAHRRCTIIQGAGRLNLASRMKTQSVSVMTPKALITSLFLLVVVAFVFVACDGEDGEPDETIFRQRMRDFVQEISFYAKSLRTDLLVIPQNGEPLVILEERPADLYLAAIDGIGRETVFCGQPRYNARTPSDETDEIVDFLTVAKGAGVTVMVTDYCSRTALVDESYARAADQEYLSFVGSTGDIELDAIPSYPLRPVNENDADVTTLEDARNFLYLISPEEFVTKERFLDAVRGTNYDIVLIDLFFEGQALNAEEVASLKKKANGASRLVIAYVNIGAAEDYRYYWQSGWRTGNPTWLAAPYEGFEDETFVQYWDSRWKSLIFGNKNSYIKRVIDAGFDGVYLDNILAYEVFEERGED